MPAATMDFSLRLRPTAPGSAVYFEVAASLVVFMLAGRAFERRCCASRGAHSKLCWPRDATRGQHARRRRRPRTPKIDIGSLAVGQRFVVRPGEKRGHRWHRGGWWLSSRPVVADGRERSAFEVAPGRPSWAVRSISADASRCRPPGSEATPCWRTSQSWCPRHSSASAPVQRLADRIAGRCSCWPLVPGWRWRPWPAG